MSEDHQGFVVPIGEESSPPRWGLPDALIAFLASLVLSNLFGSIAYATFGDPDHALPVQLPGLAGLWLGMAGVAWIVAKTKGSGRLFDDYGARLRPSKDLALGVALGVACQFLLIPLLFIPFRALAPDVDFGEQARSLAGQARGAAFAVRIVAFVVIAPAVEELFFRGLLQRSLVRRLGPVAGVTIGGLAFGLAHYQPLDPIAVLGLITALSVFGALLGVLALKTGRLGLPFVVHAAFNASTLITLALT